jgi:tetratricopeptide (TPR) repeat protein
MGSTRSWIWISLFLLIISLQPACLYSKKARVGAAALLVQDVAKAAYKQSDLTIIREGMPAYLMLMDGMVEAWPDNEQLLIAAAQAYSSFASVFAADQNEEYLKLIAEKARAYALRALAQRGFQDPTQSSFDDFEATVKASNKKDVPYLFWAATCWASWIMMHLDSIEALAELPRVELMMRRSLELDEGFYYGGPHIFMGIWLASRPAIAGGDLQKAQEHFLRALELGEGKFLMAYVYYAENYARRALDKELFVSTLKKVLETPADSTPELTLLNTVAQQKTQELLARVDEYFELFSE